MLRAHYHDQTGISVLQCVSDNEWKCLYNNANFLPKAQDARIYRLHDDIIISYNDDTDEGAYPLTYRTLHVGEEFFSLSLSTPERMLEKYQTEKIEKNATLLIEDVVVYELNEGRFVLVHKGQKFSTPVPRLSTVHKTYSSRIFFSMGTPTIPYGNNAFLGVGHVKIDFTQPFPENEALQQFINKRPKDTYHDKYIYLMFLFEFNLDFHVTRMSVNFIPTDPAHERSYLVFPSGLFSHDNKYYITYGENDTAMKVIQFNPDEVEHLLDNTDHFHDPVQCIFLQKTVVDFTTVIPKDQAENTFTFNNSMVHWKDDLFLSVYRVIHITDNERRYLNPTQIWYKIWYDDDDDMIDGNRSSHLTGRYRNSHVSR